jgi:predicted metal-dependent enzyme (double-stranded beta helix superfamily)
MNWHARSQTHLESLITNEPRNAARDAFPQRPLAAKTDSTDNLSRLVAELEALAGGVTGEAVTEVLARTSLHIGDVTAFVALTPEGYSRRCVVRTAAFEVLVMTWLPGQGSAAHDHSGSVSAFKILLGSAHETRFEQAADGLVEPTDTHQWRVGEVGLDAGETIHAVRNDSPNELLVSLHVYSPPLVELRRLTVRPDDQVKLEFRPSSN